MPSPRHNTTKAFPAVAKGLFKQFENTIDLETGDVVYVPEYFACSPSTLRSGGLSVGETCRTDNRLETVEKVFGPGHRAMYLVATQVLRQRERAAAPITRWDGSGMVLVSPGGVGNQVAPRTAPVVEKLPFTRIDFVAIPAESFGLKTVAEAVATSPAVCQSDICSTAGDRLVESLGEDFRMFFLLRNDGRLYRQGLPLPDDGEKRDPGTWLIHSLLDYAESHCGGVDGAVNREAWQQDSPCRDKPDQLVEDVRTRYVQVHESWKKDTLNVFNRAGRDKAPFLEFLKCHGCTFLHRDGFWNDIRNQMVREMADQMVERIAKTAGVFREFLPAAVDGALKRLDELADRWAAFRDETDPENYTAPASALAETEPTTRYGVKRRQ